MNVTLVNINIFGESLYIKKGLDLVEPNDYYLVQTSPLTHETVWDWCVGAVAPSIPTLFVVKGAGGFAGGTWRPQAHHRGTGERSLPLLGINRQPRLPDVPEINRRWRVSRDTFLRASVALAKKLWQITKKGS